MSTERWIRTERLLAEVSGSVRPVLARKFPSLTLNEREDIEQEVRLKLWKILRSGKKIDHWESYLWKVVYTTALDLLEPRWNEIPFDEAFGQKKASFEPRTEIDRIHVDRLIDLRRRLESLSPKRKTVLQLHLAGLNLDQTAAHLGWSRPKVRHLFYRALEDLKKKFGTAETRPDGTNKGGSHERRNIRLSASRGVRELLSK